MIMKVAMRATHEEDPGLSVVVPEADSAFVCGSSSINGGGRRKRC
jgi:hypothetical protein